MTIVDQEGSRDATGLRLGPAPEAAAAVVVAVHGRGQSAAYMVEHLVARLGNERLDDIALDEIAWIIPEAPGNAWYPLGFMAPIADNQPALDEALSVMAAIEAELHHVDPRRVVWLGFSQGACLVAEHVARHPRRWGGVAVLTGGMIGPADHELVVHGFEGNGDLEGMPAYFSNSDADDWVPLWRTQASADTYRRAGADVRVDVFPGRAHEISDDEIARMQSMIEGAIS